MDRIETSETQKNLLNNLINQRNVAIEAYNNQINHLMLGILTSTNGVDINDRYDLDDELNLVKLKSGEE